MISNNIKELKRKIRWLQIIDTGLVGAVATTDVLFVPQSIVVKILITLVLITLGLLAIWQKNFELLIISGCAFLIPAVFSYIEINKWFYGLLFAVLLISYIELTDAIIRFSKLIVSIVDIKKRKGTIVVNVSQMIKKHAKFLPLLIGIVGILSLFVMNLNKIIAYIATQQFGNSIELNSIYGIAIGATIVFGIVGIFKILWVEGSISLKTSKK